MGGLKKHMRKTFIVMWIGVLALAGIPPFSGFWSKDSIIEYTYELAAHGSMIGWVLFSFAVLAAACTIFYSMRLMGMTFYGPPRNQDDHHGTDDHDSHVEEETDEHHDDHDDDHHGTPHDPGPAMMIPLYILAAFTVIAFVVFPFIQNIVQHTDKTWLAILTEMVTVKFSAEGIVPFMITLGALALGGIPGYMMYIKNADTPNTFVPESGIRRKVFNFLRHRWYINEVYYWFLNKFLKLADWWRVRIDDKVIDGIDFKSRDAALAISTKARWIDDNLVDGFAEGISTQSVKAAETGKGAQTGLVNDYLGMMLFGIGIMVIILLISIGVI
jgi:NADH-quinone oxidoreductase subunit L